VNLSFLDRALELAAENVDRGCGGPFGALVVRDDVVLAEGANLVTSAKDPTAHAEIIAIRRACSVLGSFILRGCELYSSCEPCPMCLSASYWARLDRIYFAANRHDAAVAGFDDEFLYQELSRDPKQRRMKLIPLKHPKANYPFERWRRKADRTLY